MRDEWRKFKGRMRRYGQHYRNEQSIVHYTNGCRSKERYPSRRKALAIKEQYLAKTTSYDEWEAIEVCLEVYKCRFCGHWHLGNNREKAKRYGYNGILERFGLHAVCSGLHAETPASGAGADSRGDGAGRPERRPRVEAGD